MNFKKINLVKGILIVLFIALMLALQSYYDIASFFNPAEIEKWLASAGPAAPLIYIAIMALAIVISPIPSLPLDIAAGAFFGPILGTVYSVIGATMGAIISFLLAKHLGRGIVERFIEGHINFCVSCSDKLLTKIVFISRLIPLVSFDIVSYGAGLTKMSLRNFTAATFLGMIPLTFIYNYFGSLFVFNSGVAVGLALLLLVLFFLVPKWIEKRNLFSLKDRFNHLNDSRDKI